jgi:hypothetical protein
VTVPSLPVDPCAVMHNPTFIADCVADPVVMYVVADVTVTVAV